MDLAADLLPRAWGDGRPEWSGHEGPRWFVEVGPGVIRIGSTDRARKERTAQRETEGDRKGADQLAAWLNASGAFPEDPDPSRTIKGWSAPSRANMVFTLCALDYAPLLTDPWRVPAMVTLTYPGDWLTVAPNRKVVNKHLDKLRKRFERAWGVPLICVWKLEFQRRGAPHFHFLMVPPHGVAAAGKGKRPALGDGLQFRQWLSLIWADIVDHPDPEQRRRHEAAGTGVDYAEGLRSTDPKRVAVYFSKHGSFAAKDYQNIVPVEWRRETYLEQVEELVAAADAEGRELTEDEQLQVDELRAIARVSGPGRFWGYWGLKKKTAGAEVAPDVAVEASRTVRRWTEAQGTTRQVTVRRVNTRTGVIRYRKVRRPVRRLRDGRGWVAVNDGPAFTSQLARWLTSTSRSTSTAVRSSYPAAGATEAIPQTYGSARRAPIWDRWVAAGRPLTPEGHPLLT